MFAQLQDILAKQLNISKDKITPESRLLEDLNADSLDFVELLMTLEDEFGITISDEDAKNLLVLGDLADYVESKIDEGEKK